MLVFQQRPYRPSTNRAGGKDRFGRSIGGLPPLQPPFKAVKVTWALFHTQSGLAVDGEARVRSRRGERLPNLFAAGGAAAGVSGPHASGYLSGNGLLTATCSAGLRAKAPPLCSAAPDERRAESESIHRTLHEPDQSKTV
jgi:predicted oxidoreductase